MYEMCLISDRFSAVSLLTEACSEGAGDVFCPPKIREKNGGGGMEKDKDKKIWEKWQNVSYFPNLVQFYNLT